MEPQKYRVAIIGGGLSGAFFMRGLCRLPHLEVHIYESAPRFREEGAGIVITDNASSALKYVDPSIFECMKRAGIVPVGESDVFIAAGPDTGKSVNHFAFEGGIEPENEFLGSIARQPLLTELLDDMPQSQLHPGMKLAEIDDSAVGSGGKGGYVLKFEDGTHEAFDFVVGADGLHGRVRRYVLGESHAEYEAIPVGVWHARLMVPFAEGKAVFGNYMDEVKGYQRGWVGNRTFILNDFLNHKETVQLVVCSDEPDTLGRKEWRVKMSHAEFKERLAGQMPHLSEGVAGLFLKHFPDPFDVYRQFTHPPAPTFYRGRVCMVGDAAHTMSPANAGGGSMACEDAGVLCALLASTKTLADIERALAVWDQTRRPRCDQVAGISKWRMRTMLGLRGNSQAYLNENFHTGKQTVRPWRAPPVIKEAIEKYESLA